MGLARRFTVIASVLAVALVAVNVDAAEAAKKPKSCRLLKPAQMSKVLGQPVSGPDFTGTLEIACSFDIGPGLGETGGGMVIVSYYRGTLGKNVYNAAKATAEKIPGHKALWDVNSRSAMVFRRGKLVEVNVSFTGNTPSDESLKPQMATLAELAAKRL